MYSYQCIHSFEIPRNLVLHKLPILYYMEQELLTAYSATCISISGRFIFMYLLYTKKSVNPYSLAFSIMNVCSSALWITYSQMIADTPLLVRGSSDLVLFTISAVYIMHNRCRETDGLYGNPWFPLRPLPFFLGATSG